MRRTLLILGLGFAACGGTETPAPNNAGAAALTETERERPEEAEIDDGLEVEGLAGFLSPEQIRAGMDPVDPKITRCHKAAAKAKPYLQGKVALWVSVSRDGKVGEVRITESNAGYSELEDCITAEVLNASFDAPKGGEATFSYPLNFKSRKAIPLKEWAENDLAEVARKRNDDHQSCSGSSTDVHATFWVGKRGKVESVGLSSSTSTLPTTWRTCAVAALKEWRFVDPRGSMARITISL